MTASPCLSRAAIGDGRTFSSSRSERCCSASSRRRPRTASPNSSTAANMAALCMVPLTSGASGSSPSQSW